MASKHLEDTNAFDPFDVFDGVEEEKSAKSKGGESNPWSDSSWGAGTGELMSHTISHHPGDAATNDDNDTSFDSHAAFQFSAEAALDAVATALPNHRDNNFGGGGGATRDPYSSTSSAGQDLFPSDPMATLSGEELAVETGETTVRIAIREQFSTVYDDAGSAPSCYLEGSIYVQPSSLSATASDSTDSFCVVVKDSQGNLADLDEVHTLSSNVSTTSDIEAGDTVFKVSLPENSLLEVPVASYTCNRQLRPIPMLVKSRVQITDDVSRVGFKVRANPSNTEALNNMVILVAVPPFVQGETVKMSRKGGVWDEMKRTICWTVHKLDPGEVLEIQAQFQSGNMQNLVDVDLQFPVLVRADVPYLFSGIGISTNYAAANTNDDSEDGGSASSHIKSTVTRSTRILHRKV